ncbi:hypothetical protein ACM66B_006100 [Microbotryomycetes sp. NB124-2]
MDLPDPTHACARLLPTLLSPEPCTIPSQQLAQPTAQAHHFLNTVPTQHAYLQPVTVKNKVIELHNKLIESGHCGEVQLGSPLYSVDDTFIRALVPLGNDGLAVVVMWEEQSLPNSAFGHGQTSDDEERPAWVFQTLDTVPLPHDRGRLWHDSLEQALKAIQDLLKTRPVNIQQSGKRIKTKEEMAEGEGTTPGAYGAAEDFWAGWNDDDEAEGGGAGAGAGPDDDARAGDPDDSMDDGYWAQYGETGSQVGDGSGSGSRSIGNRSFDSLDMDDGDDDAPMPHERATLSQRAYSTAPGTPDRKPVQTRSRRSSTIRPPPTPPVQKVDPSDAAPASTSKFYLADSSASSSADSHGMAHSNPLSAAGSAVALAASTAQLAATSSSSGHSTTISAVPSFLSMDSRGSTGSFAMGAAPLDAADKLETVSKQLELLQASEASAEEEGLRFALAGVWQLYVRGRAGGSREQRDTFLRIASQVTQP